MNPVSLDIKDLLVSNNLGVFGTDIFIGSEPTDYDNIKNCVTIYDTGGSQQDARLALDETHIQIRSRNIEYINGFDILNDIKKFLEGIGKFVINDSRYLGIWASSNIAYLEMTEKRFFLWTVNFHVKRALNQDDAGNRQVIGE